MTEKLSWVAGTTGVAMVAFALVCSPLRGLAQQPETLPEKVVRAESPIEGGNALGAKKNALAAAFRQAVEKSYAEVLSQSGIVKESPRLVQWKEAMLATSQKYIRKYRILEQEEQAGQLRLMVEADVDTGLLRREMEAVSAETATWVPEREASPNAPIYLGVSMPQDFAKALQAALTTQRFAFTIPKAKDENSLLLLASKAGSPALVVKSKAKVEGKVRGTARISVQCEAEYRLFSSVGLMRTALEEDRDTDANLPIAQNRCFASLAQRIVQQVHDSLRAEIPRVPYVTVELNATDPVVVPLFLQTLKRLGAVIASEVRSVTRTQSELRVFTRISGALLSSLLIRELSPKLTLHPLRTDPDRLTLEVRKATPAEPPSQEKTP